MMLVEIPHPITGSVWVIDKETRRVMEVRSMDSTSDERVVNNVMHHEYRVLTDVEKMQMLAIKDAGMDFYNLCTEVGNSRELSLAKTKIEEAVMWAVKHITRESTFKLHL
jgi:hypothetical protein